MKDQADARQALRDFLTDMGALESRANLGGNDPEHEAFREAFRVAKKRAQEAAREYVKAFDEAP